MKLIGRIVIILIVAAAVAGLTLVLVNNGVINLESGGGNGRGGELSAETTGLTVEDGDLPADISSADGTEHQARRGRGQGNQWGEHEGQADSSQIGLNTLSEAVRNIAIIGLLIVGVSLVGKASRLISQRTQTKAAT